MPHKVLKTIVHCHILDIGNLLEQHYKYYMSAQLEFILIQ
jgi:hypothetical protein